jgi:hypothetical protein
MYLRFGSSCSPAVPDRTPTIKIIDPVLYEIKHDIDIIKHNVDFVKTLDRNFLPFLQENDIMATIARRTIGPALSF